MVRFGLKRGSLLNRLFISICILSILQILVFMVIIDKSNIIGELRNNRIETLKSIVENRKEIIEYRMVNVWTEYDNFSYAIEKIESLYNNFADTVNIDKELAETVMDLLMNTMTTGAFYISLEENDNNRIEGVYFSDMNPQSYSALYTDILMELGKPSVVSDLGVTMSSNWRAYIDSEVIERDCIKKPVEEYYKNKSGEEQDYAYWSYDKALYSSSDKSIIYSVPLIDDNNEVFGVLGVDITLEYINNFLEYGELTLGTKSTYVFGIYEESESQIIPAALNGPRYTNEILKQNVLRLKTSDDWEGVYNNADEKDELIFLDQLSLYNNNTPFEGDKWCISAIQSEEGLFESENRFKSLLLIGELTVMIFAIFAAYITSTMLVRPIKEICKKIKNINVMEPVQINKVGVEEIDILTEIIEEMSMEVMESSSKVTKIIKDANLKIGVIEINKGNNKCYVTSQVYSLLGFEEIEEDYNMVTAQETIKMLEEFYKKAVIFKGSPNSNMFEDCNEYEVIDKNNKKNWISFNSRIDIDKNLMIISDITEKVMHNIKLEYEVNHDELSKLKNMKAFKVEVTKRLKNIDNKFGAMIMWDLDNLKFINDNYGHEYGDIYIKEAARNFERLESDGGIIARRSGDEFYGFIEGDSKEKLKEIITNVHDMLSSIPMDLPDDGSIKIRASGGYAWYPEDAKEYEELVKKADFAMYDSKNTNKGTIGEFSKDNYLRDELLVNGREDLNKFIEEKSLKMAYQPIVSSETGEIYAYEALMRPKTEKLKTPFDVIRLARSQSKLNEIEKLIWNTTLEDFFVTKNADSKYKLFVNSFPNAILASEEADILCNKYKPFFNRVVTEITEGEEINKEFMELKKQGAVITNTKFALDDYGVGFNSELKLIQLQPYYVKIDKTFIDNIYNDIYRQEMVSNIISYCKRHDMKVIAEGVEEKESLQYVIKMGVDYIQGFYLARPKERLINSEEAEIIKNKVLKSKILN